MDLGRVGIWTSALDVQPLGAARDAAAELEALGYGTVWLPESFGKEPLVHAGLLLSTTSTLVLATGIASIYARDAMTAAAAQKTLESAFPGRFVLGLGVSHQPLVEGIRGHTYERPVFTMERFLDAMDAAIYFGDAPSTPTRRVLAALGPRMLHLAATKADGAHPYLAPPEHTAVARSVLGDGPLLCPEQGVVLATDPAEAREVARRFLSTYLGLPNYANNWRRLGFTDDDIDGGGSDRLVDALIAWGSLDDVRARVQAHLDAGADHVAVQVITSDRTELPMAQWRELAPALRGF